MATRGRGQERSTLTGTLKRIDRRVRLNGALDHLSIAVCVVLGLLLLFQAGKMLLPVVPPPGPWVIGASTALFAAFFVWSQRGGSRLARAADVADSRGDLHDELKTAYWFMGRGSDSPWIDLQLNRAADTARRLDARKLVPTTIPKRFLTAFGLFVALQILALVPMEGPLITFATAADSAAIAQARTQQLEDIRDLVEATEDEDDSEVLAQLEETLRELEADQLSMEELLRDLREAQNMLEEGNLEMSALEEALADLGQGFEDSEELGDLAEALQDEDLNLASELMRELSENLSNLTEEETAELMAQLREAAMADLPGLEELLESLQEAADALENQETGDAREALEEAADRMEEMADRQQAQEGRNEASEQMQAMGESATEQQSGMEQLFGMQQGDSGGEDAAEAGMAMPSDEVKQSAGSSEAQDPSGPPGHATSESMGGEQEFGAATTLEVQLSMELLDEPEPGPEPEPDPDDVFKEASRQESSTLQYRDVRGLSSYAEGSALAVDHIPWRYRSLVKKYFLAIRPRGNQ
jgi:hypothetical protein